MTLTWRISKQYWYIIDYFYPIVNFYQHQYRRCNKSSSRGIYSHFYNYIVRNILYSLFCRTKFSTNVSHHVNSQTHKKNVITYLWWLHRTGELMIWLYIAWALIICSYAWYCWLLTIDYFCLWIQPVKFGFSTHSISCYASTWQLLVIDNLELAKDCRTVPLKRNRWLLNDCPIKTIQVNYNHIIIVIIYWIDLNSCDKAV